MTDKPELVYIRPWLSLRTVLTMLLMTGIILWTGMGLARQAPSSPGLLETQILPQMICVSGEGCAPVSAPHGPQDVPAGKKCVDSRITVCYTGRQLLERDTVMLKYIIFTANTGNESDDHMVVRLLSLSGKSAAS